ncbi:Bug family tripartite tricarboxylate transporter substrate binding protein [Micrococcus terreus]|uniref:Bug family tripartite tricarboxylate transporter substrate binding protein n=1 Tax=Micrococcus terreus TaxID=574650 RepID=UPI00254C7768|nr:tripartite tricarboxylate transporter substrate-binding protein [Micrococcus terreus]MDK7702378.1 tripartite tricarboxylate transporter substrate-binding protein [Micrococcus terreus]WOO96744.1 tripartite tricarboxylate transporter substrate-binding protein [Micrococcus terreus]
MSSRTVKRTILGVAAAGVVGLALVNAASDGGEATARSKLVLMAPAAPGGGWDGFARESQQAIKAGGISNNVQVVNVPGAGGTIGLGQFAQMEGRSDMLMVTGGVMVGAVELADSGVSLDQVQPVARLADDYAALVVPADSEFQTLNDFIEAWKKDPGGTSISGGSLGSIDHLLTGLVAEEVGIDPADTNYIAYSGGGEALTSMLSGTTVGGMSGYNEVADQVEAGMLRALAISSEERLPGVDVPTFKEQGVDAVMANWRGLAAAPGVEGEELTELMEIVDEYRQTDEWKDSLERNSWTDSYMVGDEFEAFLQDEIERTQEIVEGLGL